jgi:DNA-binding NarL/FixJ family response regulator
MSFSPNDANKIRLLVAEDSPGTRANLINLLRFEKDIDVVGAVGKGEQAIEMAIQLLPDVVLTDINLPDISGLLVTSRIRAVLPFISVIVMSVQDEEAYHRRAMAAGACAFLVKPFDGDDLIENIRKAGLKAKNLN